MVDPVLPGGPPDTPRLGSEFGGREDALREFEERLEHVERDLESAFAQRVRNATTAKEARGAIATLTERAHAADHSDAGAAKRYRVQRQRKRAAYQEAQQALKQIESRCTHLERERQELERNIAELSKFRAKARRRRLWDRLRGIHEEDDTGASANVHIPAPLIALAVGALCFVLLGVVGYQASPPPAPGEGPTGYLRTVLQFYGLIDKDPAAVGDAAPGAPTFNPWATGDAGSTTEIPPPPARLKRATATEVQRIDPASIPWATSVEAYALEGGASPPEFADVLGDATPEFIFTERAPSRVLVYQREGANTYTLAAQIPLRRRPNSVASGDLDGDGRIDLVVTSDAGPVWALRNQGGGTFEVEQIHVGLSAWNVRVRDLNRDGTADIVAAGKRGVHVLPGIGKGDFGSPVHVIRQPRQRHLALADFDEDGITDVVSVSSYRWTSPPASNTLNVALLRSDLSLRSTPQPREFAPPVWRIVPFDVDHRTGADLVAMEHGAPRERKLYTLRNSGSGRFDIAGEATVQYGTALTHGDFNGDGMQDLLVGAFLYRLREMRLAGSNRRFANVSPQWSTRQDFDGDGIRDVVMWIHPDRTYILLRGGPMLADAS